MPHSSNDVSIDESSTPETRWPVSISVKWSRIHAPPEDGSDASPAWFLPVLQFAHEASSRDDRRCTVRLMRLSVRRCWPSLRGSRAPLRSLRARSICSCPGVALFPKEQTALPLQIVQECLIIFVRFPGLVRKRHAPGRKGASCRRRQRCEHLAPAHPQRTASFGHRGLSISYPLTQRLMESHKLHRVHRLGLLIKVFHTSPVRRFSAIRTEMPRSIPRQSVLYQLAEGWKASTRP